MDWSLSVPKETGFYWHWPAGSFKTKDVEVLEVHVTKAWTRAWIGESEAWEDIDELYVGDRWAGPIPMPEDLPPKGGA